MIKLSDHLSNNDPLRHMYRGRVVDNADPRRIGRIKVQIEGLLEDTNIDNLPWMYKKSEAGLGGRSDMSSFSAPEIDTEVLIEFPYKDIYAGFYTGYVQSEDTHQGYLDEDYPNSYGFRDTQNTSLKINKSKRFLEFRHASGARMFIDSDSTIEMQSDKAFIIKSGDGKTQFKFDMVTGDLLLDPKGELEIKGSKTKYTAKEVIHDVGTVDERVKGYKQSKIVGGKKTVVGGSSSESIVGNKGETVGGNVSRLVTQETEEVFGLGVTQTVVAQGMETEILQGDRTMSLLLGDYKVNVVAGNVEIETLAGTLDFKNTIGKVSIGLTGDIEVSNPLGSLKISSTGDITMDATLSMKLKSMIEAEISGLVSTKVGSAAGPTQVLGSIVTLGGAGGLPVARVGDQVIGVGNLGAPVISSIVLGSFKVLAT